MILFIVGLVGAYHTIVSCKLETTKNYSQRVGQLALNISEQGETKTRVQQLGEMGDCDNKFVAMTMWKHFCKNVLDIVNPETALNTGDAANIVTIAKKTADFT